MEYDKYRRNPPRDMFRSIAALSALVEFLGKNL